MRRVHVFDNVSLDGYFTDAKGDMSFAHNRDAEWDAFSAENAKGEGSLLFGRVTYQMMASFWPTPAAMQQMPEVAKGMNRMQKYVASRTLKSVDWQNTTLLEGDLVSAVKKLKNDAATDIVILGSGQIVSQLAEAGLIDSYQIVVCPLALGQGRTLFETVTKPVKLKLTQSRAFKNGNVVLWYEPA